MKRTLPASPRVSKTQVFDADNAITFQVSVLSNLIGRPFYASVGRHTGISLNDWRLIIAIANHPGMSQAEIVDYTGFNKSNVSRQLNNLSRYVRLEPHPVDRRKQAVYLTDAGWSTYRKMLPSLLWRQQLLVDALPPDELALFRSTLRKLVAAARQWSVTPADEK
ncbi:MAG: winged helix-turn-helix transcriptional regulator [Gammaproteobacteria bacterium]|nr:winged helix-turn-helix transcriptional regulator [Gammaproteobacteria bacterium]